LIDAIGVVLADSSRVLIVDNFEHVMPAATALADILAVTSNIKMLVTSRQALHLRWEQEYPLLPLDVPDADEHLGLDAVATSPAVELLVQRARRVRADFELTADNADAIAEIARRLDGLPLALELAAARLRILAPADLLHRLEHRLDALAGSSRDAPGRHRTLREAISWSHDLLTEDEQALFRRLGVFAGGASLDAVESVCGGDGVETQRVLDLLGSLVDKSLVVSGTDAASGNMRFHLLETIREYAMEELVAAGEAETVFDAHLAWCTDLAEGSWDRVWGPEMQATLDMLDREHDNLRTALDHAVGAGDPFMGLRTAHRLWPFWDVRGHYREGQRRLQALLDVGPSEPSLPRGRSLDALGWLTALLGDFEAAYVVMHEGLAMVRETGGKADLAASLGELGNVTFSLGYAEETEALANEALAIVTELDDHFMIGWNRFLLGYVAFLRGDLVTMKNRLDEALSLISSVFQPWGVAWAEFSLGIIDIMNGDLETANRKITESLEMRWSIRDLRGTTDCLGILAYLASARGQADQSLIDQSLMDQSLMEWSAQLHGANEVQLTANGLILLPFLQPMHEESVARLRDALDQDALDALWQVGRTTPLEKIVNEALHRDDC
jgi:predicted ATPase